MLKNPRIGVMIWFLVTLSLAPSTAAGAASLAPHLAKYDLSLQGATQGTEIASVSGLLVLEFSGTACTGYTNEVRIVTAIDTSDGNRVITDIRARTVEHEDGRLEFYNETYANGQRIELSVGTAERLPGGISVELVEPIEHELMLGADLIYPVEHMLVILQAAREGKTFVSADVYDGSEDGELVYQTATVIGPAQTETQDEVSAALLAENGLNGVPFWPITISYFEKSDEHTDATPDFVVSYLLYENGVGRQFAINYGSFSVQGRLSSLEMLPLDDCD
jgi:hypothetical protein